MKILVLDPGHGGDDPGAPPVAGKKMVRVGTMAEIRSGKATVEAPVVYDVALRLMRRIMLHGGAVHFTHSNNTTGILNTNIATLNQDFLRIQKKKEQRYHPLFSKTKQIHEKEDTRPGKRGGAQGYSLIARREITEKIKQKYGTNKIVIFISLHADSAGVRDLPLNVHIDKTRSGKVDSKSQKFAQSLVQALGGHLVPQGLGVLRGNSAEYEVLLELANLGNAAGAWRLRSPKLRERFSKRITDALLKVLPAPKP